ncbi:cryptochrome/photolyase family protein [Phytohabitans rumicis]|uniref:Deoxyribodipyrimidine photo-lyase n=1 Tax=Phytohabitans rumicis TaxID=1076125 RepID=A0A6V8LJX7_9ACTN|nr:deoxyribodipyrimidine photo-lyase [Phytohabitans rumicis]GFJ95178.1 deoxyribodipyrimidine photo-lyase [Phytohabitans rumicis]
MRTVVVLFTRDLRVHDNPALHAACAMVDQVVPLFVLDPRIRAGAHRHRYLAGALADLRGSLRERGGDLVIRHGDPVTEAVRVARAAGAFGIGLAADASRYAADRQRRLATACARERLALKLFDGVSVVPPGALRPSGGGDHYKVFTPYWRAWQAYPRRAELPAPRRIALPPGLAPGELPDHDVPGGETVARHRLAAWRPAAADYADRHDDLAGDGTSRLSAALHFGCLSPVTAASVGVEPFVRQLCWRDFYHQVLAAFPDLPDKPYRPGVTEQWRHDPAALDAWRHGRTGVPVVDAGMRQLAAEGFLHNRARLITAAYLTKHLALDWREGARWYAERLLDADVANNCGNWQWVAGTGNDTKPYRRFNPVRQAHRFDPDGTYVRRWLPELAGVPGPAVHEPWRLPDPRRLDYPPPIVDGGSHG